MTAGRDDFMPNAASRANQADRLLEALQAGPVTTADARKLLGLSSSPAARALELRKAGHVIKTRRISAARPDGTSACVACYVLERQP